MKNPNLSRPGKANGMYGKTHTPEARLKISQTHRGRPKPKIQGEKHYGWSGGSRAYHSRVATKVWEKYWNEKIPEKHLIHHFDRDYTNNVIYNLVLSDYSWHTRIHPAKNKRRRQVNPHEILLQEI